MATSCENYYTKLINTITDFINNNNLTLSKANIREAILQVTMEDEEEPITDANNVTADTLNGASSSQRENLNAILTSEKLEKSVKLVDAINNLTINEVSY